MSAVRQQEILQFAPPEPEEPTYFGPGEMSFSPCPGDYVHSDEVLRYMWSRIWKCFKSRRLCEGFIQFNAVHSLENWSAAFETVRQMKDGQFHYILFVKKIADRYELEETPVQKVMREAAENKAKLAEQAKRGMKQETASPTVLKYWAEKGKTKSLDDIPDDDPTVLRMARKLKG